jgi:predicted enzyme related to lactoylglutathione lyase
MGNPVLHFEIAGKDGDALRDFYAELFGWKATTHAPSGYHMVDTESERGVAGGITTSPMGQPYVTFYVEVDDLQVAIDRAVALGGEAFVPPTDIPEGPSVAVFKDPEGNAVGLVHGM